MPARRLEKSSKKSVKDRLKDDPCLLDRAVARVVYATAESFRNCGDEVWVIQEYCEQRAESRLPRHLKDRAGDYATDVVLDLIKEKGPRYDVERPAKPLLNKILKRKVCADLRKDACRSRHAAAVDFNQCLLRPEEGVAVDQMTRDEVQEVIELALFDMPPRYRAMLDLYGSTMPSMEVANLLHISVDALYLVFMRARDSFRKHFRLAWTDCGLPSDMMPKKIRNCPWRGSSRRRQRGRTLAVEAKPSEGVSSVHSANIMEIAV